MFRRTVLIVATLLLNFVNAEEPPKIAKDTAELAVMSWRVLSDGKEDGQPLPGSYLGAGLIHEKVSTGTTVANAATLLAGAILPIPQIKTKITDLIVAVDEKNDAKLSGPFVGFILFRNDLNARWGKTFHLVRLDSGPLGYFFQMEGNGKISSNSDLPSFASFLQTKQGNWYLKLLKPLEPGRYAVANLMGAKAICWHFLVTERLVPQDSPSELPKTDAKK